MFSETVSGAEPDRAQLRKALDRLTAAMSRRAPEAFAAYEYHAGRLSHPDLRDLLDFATHAELDGFLKARGIFEDYTQSDLDRERQSLDQLAL